MRKNPHPEKGRNSYISLIGIAYPFMIFFLAKVFEHFTDDAEDPGYLAGKLSLAFPNSELNVIYRSNSG